MSYNTLRALRVLRGLTFFIIITCCVFSELSFTSKENNIIAPIRYEAEDYADSSFTFIPSHEFSNDQSVVVKTTQTVTFNPSIDSNMYTLILRYKYTDQTGNGSFTILINDTEYKTIQIAANQPVMYTRILEDISLNSSDFVKVRFNGTANSNVILDYMELFAQKVTLSDIHIKQKTGSDIQAGQKIGVKFYSQAPLTFDTSVSSISVDGSASNKIDPNVNYEWGGKLAELNILETFNENDEIILQGLKMNVQYKYFSPQTLDLYLDGQKNKDDQKTIITAIEIIEFSPLSLDQNNTSYDVIEITIQDNLKGEIEKDKGLKIQIRNDEVIWDNSILSVDIMGTSKNRIESIVSYSADSKEVVFSLNEDFWFGDSLTINGLKVKLQNASIETPARFNEAVLKNNDNRILAYQLNPEVKITPSKSDYSYYLPSDKNKVMFDCDRAGSFFYTLDNSEPNESSSIYYDPISLMSESSIKFKVILENGMLSDQVIFDQILSKDFGLNSSFPVNTNNPQLTNVHLGNNEFCSLSLSNNSLLYVSYIDNEIKESIITISHQDIDSLKSCLLNNGHIAICYQYTESSNPMIGGLIIDQQGQIIVNSFSFDPDTNQTNIDQLECVKIANGGMLLLWSSQTDLKGQKINTDGSLNGGQLIYSSEHLKTFSICQYPDGKYRIAHSIPYHSNPYYHYIEDMTLDQDGNITHQAQRYYRPHTSSVSDVIVQSNYYLSILHKYETSYTVYTPVIFSHRSDHTSTGKEILDGPFFVKKNTGFGVIYICQSSQGDHIFSYKKFDSGGYEISGDYDAFDLPNLTNYQVIEIENDGFIIQGLKDDKIWTARFNSNYEMVYINGEQ